MKVKITLLSALLIAFFALNAQQQVPNGGFETWTSPAAPDGWTTLDQMIPAIAPSGLSERDTVNKVEGTTSVKLTSKYVALAQDTVPGILSVGTGGFGGNGPFFNGAPFSGLPDTLFFSYKYTPVGIDTGIASLGLHATNNTWPLGISVPLTATAGLWRNIYVPLTSFYTNHNVTIDSIQVQFVSSMANTPRQGSTLNIDAVRFGYVGGVTCTAPTSPSSATVSPDTIMQGSSATLTVQGGSVGDGTWEWYTDNCGGTHEGTGASISVSPAATTTYYVRGEGCGTNTACSQVVVVVNTGNCTPPTSPSSATSSADTITQGNSATLTVHGGSLGDGAWKWYSGSCGGTAVGTGASVTVSPSATTTYYVRGEGCGANTACSQVTVVVSPGTGINDLNNIALNVYPNPASEMLTVSADQNLAGYTFTIFDITGRVMNATTLNGSTSTVNVASLALGNYLYRITDKNNQVVAQNRFTVAR